MDTFNITGRKSLVPAVAMAALVFCSYSHAGVSSDGGYWVIERGDSVYSIARKVFPDDAKKRSRFRRELLENNADVFKGNPGHINIGDRLRLPAFAVAQPVEVAQPPVVEAPAVQAEVPVEKQPEAVTPDPEDVIGRVVVSVGKMQASNRGGFRELMRNSKVFKGDTLETASSSYTQVRMKDGALISLRPNTKLVIRDYNFNGSEDGTEKSLMELVRGGFRTITGYIGHKNKNNYRVRTGVATIGIRGTHYGLMVCAEGSCAGEDTPLEDGVYGGVVDGSIVVENETGQFTFNNDQYFHVATNNTPAKELLVPPPVFHGRSEKMMAHMAQDKQQGRQQGDGRPDGRKAQRGDMPGFREGGRRGGRLGALVKNYIENRPRPLVLPDQVNDAIKDAPKVDIKPAPDGSGLLMALNDSGSGSTVRLDINSQTQAEVLLGSKKLPSGDIVNNIPVAARDIGTDQSGNPAVYKVYLPSAVAGVTNEGGDQIGVNWGRWDASYEFTINDQPQTTQGPLHYIYSDKITTPAQLTALGGLLGTQSYTLVNPNGTSGTIPTASSGNAATLGSLNITADFVNAEILDYSISVAVTNGPAFNLMLDANAGPVTFNKMGDIRLIDISVGQTRGNAAAAFVGPNAEGIITTYSLEDQASGEVVQGAAALKQGAPQF